MSLETLEAREVPAANTWLGGNGDFRVEANWSAGHAPIATDDLYFSGATSNANATFYKGVYTPANGGSTAVDEDGNPLPGQTVTFGAIYSGIHIVNGYAGTVYLPFSITFGTYQQTSGNTSQTGADGTDIFVTGGFQWTGGNLNNSSITGTVHFQGVANATIVGTSGGLKTGSTLSVESYGSIRTSLTTSGTIVFSNSAEMVVNGGDVQSALLNGAPVQTTLKPLDIQGTAKRVVVNPTGVFNGSKIGLDTMGLFINGGKVEVLTEKLTVTGYAKVAQGNQNQTDMPGIIMSSGELFIRNGQILSALHDLSISGGEFRTLAAADGIEQIATLEGSLTITGGSIQLGILNEDIQPKRSNLKVTGTAFLLGGTFTTFLDALTPLNRDFISAKKLEFLAAFSISPQIVGDESITSGKNWTIFTSTDGIQSAETQDPTVPTGYTKHRVGTANKEFEIRHN